MDSEADSSALSPLTTLDSVKSTLKTRRSTRTTWAHARAARDKKRVYEGKTQIKYCIHICKGEKVPQAAQKVWNFKSC